MCSKHTPSWGGWPLYKKKREKQDARVFELFLFGLFVCLLVFPSFFFLLFFLNVYLAYCPLVIIITDNSVFRFLRRAFVWAFFFVVVIVIVIVPI